MLSLIFFVVTIMAPAQDLRPDAGDLRLRAETGDPSAANAYAESCFNRFYYSESVKWFQLAAEAGITNAQWRLGEMLLHGKSFLDRSVAANPTEGLRWLQHAAFQGHTQAQWELGRAFKEGVGTKRNLRQAFYWLQVAANKGHILAAAYRDELATKLPASEVQSARESAAAFRPGSRDARTVLWESIKLKGISGGQKNPLALINDQTLGEGETGVVRIGKRQIEVRCSQITKKSAVVELLETGEKRRLTID